MEQIPGSLEVNKNIKIISGEDFHSQMDADKTLSERAHKLTEQSKVMLRGVMKEKYKLDKLVLEFGKVERIIQGLGIESLEELKGKKMLDLGCGHTIPADMRETAKKLQEKMKESGMDAWSGSQLPEYRELQDRLPEHSELLWEIAPGASSFEPWVPRILHELGAEMTGVDIGNLEGEEFTHFGGINLLDTDILERVLPKDHFDAVHVRLVEDSPVFKAECRKRGITPKEGIEKIKNAAKSFTKEGGILMDIQ